jgi:probable F420-dependent oxidoreductase
VLGIEDLLKIGVYIPHTGRLASPEFIREFCTTAEVAGYHSLWAMDHVIMPIHIDSKMVLGRTPTDVADGAVSELMSPNYEMMSTLLWVAGFTTRIKLGTGVAILPIRNTLLNARQLSSLDVYSGGRLIYGVGVGWVREEAEAMNMPWDHRGLRSEEHIAILRALWTTDGPAFEFHGRFHEIAPMDPEPLPIQRPIPIMIGGHSEIAIERAGRIGDGWIAGGMAPDRLRSLVNDFRESAKRSGRDPDALSVYAAASRKSNAGWTDLAELYAEIGVNHLQVHLAGESREQMLQELETLATEVFPRFQ